MTENMTPWGRLSAEEQLALREAYGRDPACLTGTCDLTAKLAHFSDWLATRGIAFTEADLRPKSR